MLYDKSNTQMLTGNVFSEPMSGLIKKCYNKVVECVNTLWIYVYKCMYCVSAIKYNFYYHSSNRIQLTTMFFLFLLNVMYLSLVNFAWCIKYMFISRYFYLWNLKKISFLSYLKSILLLNYSLLAVIYSTCTFVWTVMFSQLAVTFLTISVQIFEKYMNYKVDKE